MQLNKHEEGDSFLGISNGLPIDFEAVNESVGMNKAVNKVIMMI